MDIVATQCFLKEELMFLSEGFYAFAEADTLQDS